MTPADGNQKTNLNSEDYEVNSSHINKYKRGNRGAILVVPRLLYVVIRLPELIWQGLEPGGHQTLRDQRRARGLVESMQVHVNS